MLFFSLFLLPLLFLFAIVAFLTYYTAILVTLYYLPLIYGSVTYLTYRYYLLGRLLVYVFLFNNDLGLGCLVFSDTQCL